MTYRIVADTNVVISAMFWGGQPRRVIELVEAGLITLLSTADMVLELQITLSYVKFAQRIKTLNLTVEDIIESYIKLTETVVPADVSASIVRDKKDRIILAAAVGGRASYIISGDKDLLTLVHYEAIPIVTPTQFLALKIE